MIVGIDFGTCYSSVAVMVGEVPFTDFIKDTTGLGVPSQYLQLEGKEYFGEECESGSLLQHRGEIIDKMKKKVRMNPNNIDKFYKCGNRQLRLREIIEKYIGYLLKETRKSVENDPSIENKEIEEITIAAPVGIANGKLSSTDYRSILIEIIQKLLPQLNINKIHVIDEPAAAAVSYLYGESVHRSNMEKQTVLVFDLGGGTLDISIVQHDPLSHSYTVVAKDGDLDLGGDDWDDKYAELIKERLDIQESDLDSEESLYDFRKAVIESKMELTDSEDTLFSIKIKGKRKQDKFTRKEFEDATSTLLDSAMNLLQRVINNHESGISDIDKIVLVGGSSNMPQIRNKIGQVLGKTFDKNKIVYHEPSKAIAQGAAIYSFIEASSDYAEREIVINKAAHTYGITSYLRKEDKVYVANLIFKNAKLDDDGEIIVRDIETYMPIRDDQTRVIFDVYESDMPNTGKNELMDVSEGKKMSMTHRVPVPEEYTGKARSFKFYIEMSLDENGVLKVSSIDKTTGEVRSTVRNK